MIAPSTTSSRLTKLPPKPKMLISHSKPLHQEKECSVTTSVLFCQQDSKKPTAPSNHEADCPQQRLTPATPGDTRTPIVIHVPLGDSKQVQKSTVTLNLEPQLKKPRSRPFAHRHRMTKELVSVLEQEFCRSGGLAANWELEHQKEIGERLGISRVKVYKWLYDRKRKEQRL